MFSSQNQKNKINLTEYDFEFDLRQRLILSNLSVFEIEVLKEIVSNSLKFPISELCETLEAPLQEIQKTLEKLKSLKLFYIDNSIIYVYKEFRKYFEVQIERFTEDFKPDLDYFQSLLHLIPIEVLPNWFCISKSSDDIFQSIIDNYFLTPQLFTRYLKTLQFNDTITSKVIDLVYSHIDLSLDVNVIISKLSITREELEKILIVLELHKVCCLKYSQDKNTWKQTVTPFNEWVDYMIFKNSITIKTITSPSEIIPKFLSSFVECFDDLLNSILKNPICTKKLLDSEHPDHLLHHFLIKKICILNLGFMEEDCLHPTLPTIEEWFQKSEYEKCMLLYFTTFNTYKKQSTSEEFYDKDIREVEKAIKTIIGKGWVYLEDFINNMTVPLGRSKQVTLQKKGKRWCYTFPEYDQNQKDFVCKVIEEHLFQSGMVNIGFHNNKPCLTVTPFGKISLGD